MCAGHAQATVVDCRIIRIEARSTISRNRHPRAGIRTNFQITLLNYVILAKDSQGSPIQLHRELILCKKN